MTRKSSIAIAERWFPTSKRTPRLIVGGLAILSGPVWALQGAGVLPGSMMSGDPKWIVIGTVVALGGAGLLMSGMRAR